MKITYTIIPKGQYFIGDPCHVFSDDVWSKILRQNTHNDIVFKIDDKKFVMCDIGGDGDIQDSTSHVYSIDSGSLGIVPLDVLDLALLEKTKHLGKVVTFEKTTEVKFMSEEFVQFGDLFFDLMPMDFDYEMEIEKRKFWESWSYESK